MALLVPAMHDRAQPDTRPTALRRALSIRGLVWVVLGMAAGEAAAPGQARADDPPTETWDGFRNQLQPDAWPTTRQDFGWQATRRAGGREAGELGGWVSRSLTPARYVRGLERPLTLEAPFRASGRLAVTRAEGASGALCGWRNATSRGWRTPNSLAFRVDGNGGNYWLFYEYGTRSGFTGGGGAFAGDRYQTTPTPPFLADGTEHIWQLAYEPRADGTGTLEFVIDDRRYALTVPAEHRADGVSLDEFGLWNPEVTGSGLELWIDDLVVDGQPWSFDRDPGWRAVGNRAELIERIVRPFHQFGLAPSETGGTSGDVIGGIIWRDERPAYFGARVSGLSLDTPLAAAGTIRFLRAGADSGVYLGFFHAATKQSQARPEHEAHQANYLAILLEGPSRVGHFFRPGYGTRTGGGRNAETGPVLRPDGVTHRWRLEYDPAGADKRGEITVALDDFRQAMPLDVGARAVGASFDRFGLFNLQSGGWHVEIYLSDLEFTGRGSHPPVQVEGE